MSVNNGMRRRLPEAAPATVPQLGRGSVAPEQIEMVLPDGKTPSQRIADLVAALVDAVHANGGVVALAAEMERNVTEVSRRVNRADDGKGTRMEPFLSYLAFLDDAAFKLWHDLSGAARGLLPAERMRKLSPQEQADELRALSSEDARRAWEKRRGLPSGSLG